MFLTASKSLAPAPPQRFICPFPNCSPNYNKAWKLDSHLCKHTGERLFVCDHEGCTKAFSHILSFHEEERPFVCEHTGCGKTLAMKQGLSKQAVVHDPDKKKMKLKKWGVAELH
ncbi:hypothetical protein J1605_018002 [Eschrichtius robustus]|uniref:Transcription factor IIIA n=1 Tax=Eschrichtius robustus TaxID=9764 RepID=A0AB34I155_ESCRO|nr:hypothetical protein J1605_018002 [Eschrichtius robustus]